ncbi:MAG: site-specific integrase [Thermoplasmatota archaeon]
MNANEFWNQLQIYLHVHSGLSDAAARGTSSVLARMPEMGFQLNRFLLSREDAIVEGDRFLLQQKQLRGEASGYNNYVKAISHAFASIGWQLGKEPYWTCADVRHVPIPMYTQQQVQAWSKFRPTTDLRLQTAAIWELNVNTGIRRGTMAAMRRSHFDFDEGTYFLTRRSKKGKVGKHTFANPKICEYGFLQEWLKRVADLAEDPETIWIIKPQREKWLEYRRARGLSVNVEMPAYVRADAEDLGSKYTNAKQFIGFSCAHQRGRATFATYLWRATRDLILIKEYLGHTSVATTERYLRRIGAWLMEPYPSGIALPMKGYLGGQQRLTDFLSAPAAPTLQGF